MERMGLPVERIVAAGGGAKSAAWCQTKSDVTKKTVLVPKIKSVSAYGSAMLAAVGTGQLPSLKAASEKWVEYDRTFEPSELRGITYERLYEIYTSAYWSLKGIFLKLSELQK
jgi:xylulokinase